MMFDIQVIPDKTCDKCGHEHITIALINGASICFSCLLHIAKHIGEDKPKRWSKAEDKMLGKEFGARREITTKEFVRRIEKLNRMDILAYQLNTCPACLGELKGESINVGKRTRKCENCSFVLTISYRGK